MDSSIGDGLRLVEIENIDVADPAALSALLKKGEVLEHHRVSTSSRRANQSSSKNNETSEISRSQQSYSSTTNNTYMQTPRGKKPSMSNESPRDIRQLRSYSPSARSDTSGNSSGNSTPTSPPPRSRSSLDPAQAPTTMQKEVWYSKAWMCGFTDAFHFGSP